jgi:hypothetical protein
VPVSEVARSGDQIRRQPSCGSARADRPQTATRHDLVAICSASARSARSACRPRIALRTGYTGRTCDTRLTIFTGYPLDTLGTSGTGNPNSGLALGTLLTRFPLKALGTLRAGNTGRAVGASRAGIASVALLALLPCRSSYSRRSLRTGGSG